MSVHPRLRPPPVNPTSTPTPHPSTLATAGALPCKLRLSHAFARPRPGQQVAVQSLPSPQGPGCRYYSAATCAHKHPAWANSISPSRPPTRPPLVLDDGSPPSGHRKHKLRTTTQTGKQPAGRRSCLDSALGPESTPCPHSLGCRLDRAVWAVFETKPFPRNLGCPGCQTTTSSSFLSLPPASRGCLALLDTGLTVLAVARPSKPRRHPALFAACVIYGYLHEPSRC